MAIELLTAAVNAPRRGYDPVSGALRGLLIEESRTNTILWSQQFTNAAWSPVNSVPTDNVANAPDGTLTAATFVEDTTAAANHQMAMQGTATVAAGDQWAASIFVKSYSGSRYFQLLAAGTAINNQIFLVIDTNTGDTVKTTSGTLPQNVLVEDCGSGWYRIGYSLTADADGNLTFYIRTASTFAIGQQQYDGDGSSGFYIWGSQLEAGAFVTSYIPTTSAAVTRANDSCSLDVPWMRSDRGCFFAEAMLPHAASADTNPRVFRLGFSTGSWDLTFGASNISTNLNDGTNNRNAVVGAVVGAFESHRVAATFGDGRIAICADGGSVASNLLSGSGGLPSGPATSLRIGAYSPAGNCLNGWLKTLRYFPYSPSDADLQALTT